MKNIIKLGMLAALANVSVHAVTVDFSTPTVSGSYVPSITSGGVVVTGYTYAYNGIAGPHPGYTNTNVLVSANSTGVGVSPSSLAGINTAIEGNQMEYLLIDFGATATGNVKIDSIVLNYPTNDPNSNPVVQPVNPYFRYAWLNSAPSGPNPYPGSPLAGSPPGTTPFSDTTLTPVTTFTSPAPTHPSDLYTFNTQVAGSGRYLLLQAINGTYTTSNMFQLNQIQYSSVPDGASTLALMGAALATLGLAGRRRKA